MAEPVFATNDVPTAVQVNEWFVNVQYARKTASEDRLSTTVLANDTHLSVAIPAAGTYLFTSYFGYDGATAGDLKIGFSLTGGFTLVYGASGPGVAAAAYTDDQMGYFDGTMSPTFGCHGVATLSALVLTGTLIAGGAGTVQFQWAQATSSATRTRMFANSFLDFQRRE